MKYIDVTSKKTGRKITILEDEFNSKLFSKKEEKAEVKTKEEKVVRKTKAKTITSKSFK